MITKNEGPIERGIQIVIFISAFLGAFFWLSGGWKILLLVFAGMVMFFSIVGFCPLYFFIGKKSKQANDELTGKNIIWLFVLGLLIFSGGAYASNFFSKKFFIEEFNVMNKYYKQTLFETGQGKRSEAQENYAKLINEYAVFENKYSTYQPYVLRQDSKFVTDLQKIESIIADIKSEVESGDLQKAHVGLEAVRPIMQDIFKRNGFSMLAVALVDFHDAMEKVLESANVKNSAEVMENYSEADAKLKAVEEENDDAEIQAIRENLDEIFELAKNNQVEELPKKASELKSSFVKVYLKRG